MIIVGITIRINIFLYCYNLIFVQNAIKPVTFSCLLHIRHLKEMEMAGIKLLETCPYCGFADIPSKEDEVFCCLNLDCMRETCRSVFYSTQHCHKSLKYSHHLLLIKFAYELNFKLNPQIYLISWCHQLKFSLTWFLWY